MKAIPNLTKSLWGFVFFISLLTTTTAQASLVLDQNRVVFPASDSPVAMVKVDNPTKTDFLIQTWIEDKNGKQQEDLFVDPPLAKIKALHKVALRITAINSALAQQSEEQLYWLNVKEIPKLDANSTGARLAIVMRTRVKILYRPKSLDKEMGKQYEKLTWKHSASGLIVHNPTPYYITFNKVWLGDNSANTLALDMIAPHSDLSVKKDLATTAQIVRFNIIDDFGDNTDTATAKIN